MKITQHLDHIFTLIFFRHGTIFAGTQINLDGYSLQSLTSTKQ